MIEVVKGTGVYWGTAHQQLVNNAATPTKLTNAMVDVFLTKKPYQKATQKVEEEENTHHLNQP